MANTVAVDVKINALEASKTLKDLRTNLKEAISELAALEQGSDEFKRLSAAIGNSKDRIDDLKDAIAATTGGGQFESFAKLGSSIAGGFQVAQGAMALFGSESQEVEKALLKVQAAMALSQGLKDLEGIKDAFANAKNVASDFGKAAIDALKGMKAGIAATGIGVLLVAVGALVAYWDDIKGFFDTLSEGATKTKALNESLEDFKKGAQDAFKEVNDVKVAFQQAKDGVLSKKDALQKYNETLGPVLGNAKSLNEAEDIMIKKADAYIEVQARKSRANAMLAKAAEAETNALTANLEDQTNILEKGVSAFFAINMSNAAMADDFIKKQQEKGVKEQQEKEKKRAKILSDAAIEELKIADDKMKQFDIKEKTNNEKKVDLTAELNAKIKALQNEAIDDQRAADKAKEETDYLATVKEYETKYKGYENLTTLLEKLRLSHLNKISEIDNKYNIEEDKKEKEKQQNKIDLAIQGIENERKAIENERKLTFEEQIAFENRIYEQTISNSKLTIAEKEKLELEHKAKLKGLNDGFQAEIQASQDKFNADQISIQETQIATAQRLKQNTDQMELEAAKLKLDTILNDNKKSYAERIAAQEEYDAKVAEIDARDAERKRQAAEATLNITKGALQATADLVSAFAGKSVEAQKKAFEFQKGVNIANAIIDTYQSAVAAYKGSIGVPIVGPVLAPIAAATAVAAGIANIRKIEQTNFNSKDTPSSGGGGGGGSFAPNLSAPVSNTSTNLASIGFGQQAQEPVKVFVTETDISSSQKNVQKIEQKASIE